MPVSVSRSVPSLLTLQEVSTALRISEKTVRRMIARREIRAFRVGGQLRVQRDSVTDLLKRGEV
jgi:excisionase family DNA binding protein